MDYELAKELEEAGFDQDWPDEYGDSQAMFYCIEKETGDIKGPVWIRADADGVWSGDYMDWEWKIDCKVPSLDELIQACGDDFVSLEKFRDNYYAVGKFIVANYQIEGHGIYYKTPSEAVARLWLKLNKTNV